jgi:hypothetical protein
MKEEPVKQSNYKNLNKGHFKKGVSGNPKGRPVKELSITQALRDYMHEIPQITVGGSKNTDKTWAQLVALGMLLKSVKGDASMAREIIDRLEGKVAQPVTGEGGGPVMIEYVKASGKVDIKNHDA